MGKGHASLALLLQAPLSYHGFLHGSQQSGPGCQTHGDAITGTAGPTGQVDTGAVIHLGPPDLWDSQILGLSGTWSCWIPQSAGSLVCLAPKDLEYQGTAEESDPGAVTHLGLPDLQDSQIVGLSSTWSCWIPGSDG
ncbi:hypothetical protein BTVI_37213 [Pitangus sulphuratus]|nr:hypothetical protein BTVI_37213 [Pitangus sulphuratus]